MKKADAVIKSDTAANWAKAVKYIPDVGTIIIYQKENGTIGVKLGDGITAVNNLPFLTNPPSVIQDTLEL